MAFIPDPMSVARHQWGLAKISVNRAADAVEALNYVSRLSGSAG